MASQIFKAKNIHCQHCSHLIFSCSDRIGSCEIVFLAISRNALIIPDGWAGWRLMLVGVITVATSSGMFNCCQCVNVYARTKGQCSKFWRRRPNRKFELRTIVRQSAGKPVQRKYWSSTNIATNTGYKDWSPKFETGLNITIGIVQKVEERPSCPFAKMM